MNWKLKNPTPRMIALLASLTISGLYLIFFALLLSMDLFQIKWWTMILIILFIFISSYFVITFFLKNYIYRKIKLIYKTIRETKVSANEDSKNIDLSNNLINVINLVKI